MPSTVARVQQNTDEDINRAIRKETQARLALYAKHPEKIDEPKMDPTEPVIDAPRRGRGLRVLVSGFLLQQALQGWCPPLPLLRRLGFRTAEEISQERNALKALRGDFDKVKKAGDKVQEAARAAGLGEETHGRTMH